MAPRIRNAKGYPSTAVGIARRAASAAEQQMRRRGLMSALRAQRPRSVFASGAGRAAYSRARALRRAAGETNYVDVASATYALDTTGSVTLLNTVAQGAGTSQRIGKRIVLKSLQARGFVSNKAGSFYNDCAVLIVYDSKPIGTLPAVTDILNTASSASFNNDANAQRFRILKRLDFVLSGAPATTVGDGPTDSADFFLNLKGAPTVFKLAGTGAIGDQEEGSLLLVTVGHVAAGATTAEANLGFRLRFVDV